MINLLCSQVLAKCDFDKLEKKGEYYQYSIECHKEVGRLYNITNDQDRLINIIEKENDYLKKQKNYPVWVSYGLGVIATLASVWAAGQVSR